MYTMLGQCQFVTLKNGLQTGLETIVQYKPMTFDKRLLGLPCWFAFNIVQRILPEYRSTVRTPH